MDELVVEHSQVVKIAFLNPREYDNGFCVSLSNRSIQDLLDHGV